MFCQQFTSVSRKIEICARRSQRYVSGKVYEYNQSARVPHQRSSKDEVWRRFSLGARWASHFGKICNQKTKTNLIPQVQKKLQKPSMVTAQIQKLQPGTILIFQNFLCLASLQVSYSYSCAPSHLVPHLNE